MSFEEELAQAAIRAFLGTDVKAELIGEVEVTEHPDGHRSAEVTTDIYLTAEELADALGITPEELAGMGSEVGISTAQIAAALHAAERSIAPPAPPKRGTPGYREVIQAVAWTEELEKVINALKNLWDEYGWRAVLDVMAQWVRQIDAHPQLDPRSRDMSGVVNIATVLVTNPDEDHVLRMASDLSTDYIQQGVAPHEAFRKGMDIATQAVKLAQDWLPHLRAAFAAAREDTPDPDRAVFAALFHGPGRTDKHDLIQAAVLLGTAAMGVRNRDKLTKAAEHLPPGHTLVDNGEINPLWKSGYKRHPNRS